MKNKEMLDYLQICENREVDLYSSLNRVFLDSEVSIRDLYIKFKDLDCTDDCIGTVLRGIFNKFTSDEEKAEAMEKINMITDLYSKYLGKISFMEYKRNLKQELLISDIEDIDTIVNRLRIVKFGTRIFLGKNRYLIYRFKNVDGSSYITLGNSLEGMEHVGAITFKNDKYVIHQLHNKNDIKNINKLILGLDYDLCVCIDREKIMKKMH